MRHACLVLAVLTGGCGARFYLTAPEVAGLPGETAPVVVRLQRSELWLYAPPSATAAITFRLEDRPVLSARTDGDGYAGVGMELPRAPGRYEIAIYHQDVRGDSLRATTAAYVLDADRPVAAIDFDSLPQGVRAADAAVQAVLRISRAAQVVYTTEDYAARPGKAHALLARTGYPDAPVLPLPKARAWYDWPWWRRDDRRPGDRLRDALPNLRWGVAAEDDAAETFHRIGLKTLAVRDRAARKHADAFFASWTELVLPPEEPPTTQPSTSSAGP